MNFYPVGNGKGNYYALASFYTSGSGSGYGYGYGYDFPDGFGDGFGFGFGDGDGYGFGSGYYDDGTVRSHERRRP